MPIDEVNTVSAPTFTQEVRESIVSDFQSTAATGTASSPNWINDDNTGMSCYMDAEDEYAEIDYGLVVSIQRWRMYGNTNNNGSGRMKIQYRDLITHTWVDWVVDIPTRATADWTSFATVSIVNTDKVRIVATTIDTENNKNYIAEMEVIY